MGWFHTAAISSSESMMIALMNMCPFLRPGSYYKTMVKEYEFLGNLKYDGLDKYKWLNKYFPIEKN